MAAEENAPFIFEAVMTTTRLLLISFVLLCLIAFVRNVHAQDAKMAKQDMQAMSRLAQADMAEIAAGRVAAQKGSSDEVKKYGPTRSTRRR